MFCLVTGILEWGAKQSLYACLTLGDVGRFRKCRLWLKGMIPCELMKYAFGYHLLVGQLNVVVLKLIVSMCECYNHIMFLDFENLIAKLK